MKTTPPTVKPTLSIPQMFVTASLAAFVVALFNMWYDDVFFGYNIGYWVAYGLAAVISFVMQGKGLFTWFVRLAMPVIFAAAAICQILAWGKLIVLPLLK